MVHRALLVGCNYPGNPEACHLSYGSTYIMRDFLINTLGYQSGNIRVLTDERNREGAEGFANLANFKAELARLVKETKKGDVVVLFFAGHGFQQASTDSSEGDDQKGEGICLFEPELGRDSEKAISHYSDADLLANFLKPLDDGATLLAFFDCEHSGTMVNMPFNYVPGPGLMRSGAADLAGFGNEKCVAIGACSDAQDDIIEGLLTTAIIMAFGKGSRKHKKATWAQVAAEIFGATGSTGALQIPVVSFSKESYANGPAC